LYCFNWNLFYYKGRATSLRPVLLLGRRLQVLQRALQLRAAEGFEGQPRGGSSRPHSHRISRNAPHRRPHYLGRFPEWRSLRRNCHSRSARLALSRRLGFQQDSVFRRPPRERRCRREVVLLEAPVADGGRVEGHDGPISKERQSHLQSFPGF